METKPYSFCESTAAGPQSQWHIRKLTERGYKYGGGIDTGSLCGHVKKSVGWDLDVDITDFHLEKNACTNCRTLYLKAIK